jgi:hypothetical protein
MQKTLDKVTAGFGLAVAISIIFTALLVVIKETNKGLKDWFTTLLGHHWTTHGVITILLFVILGLLLSQLRIEENWGINARKLLIIIILSTILAGLIINGFYLLHL